MLEKREVITEIEDILKGIFSLGRDSGMTYLSGRHLYSRVRRILELTESINQSKENNND